MNEAKERWGFADVINGDKQSRLREIEGSLPEKGGPVHQMLVEKHRKKLERRAKRYASQGVA